MTTNQDVITYITRSASPGDIDVIYEAIKIRTQYLNRSGAVSLRIDDRVVTLGLGTKKYNGLTGRIVDIRQTKVLVRFDRPVWRSNRYCQELLVPASCVKLVEG